MLENSIITYQRQHDRERWIKPVADLNDRFHSTPVRIKPRLVCDNLCLINDSSVVDTFANFWASARDDIHTMTQI